MPTKESGSLNLLWNGETWKKILRYLEEANSEVCILFPWITYDLLVDKIIDLKKKNPALQIRVMTSIDADNDGHVKNIHRFDKAGVNVRTIYKPFPHAKVICIDRKILVVGSMNASFTAAQKNIECAILTSSKEACDCFCEEFDSMWRRALLYGVNLSPNGFIIQKSCVAEPV